MKFLRSFWRIALLVAVAAAVVCFIGRDGFEYSPFARYCEIDSPSNAFFGSGDDVYVIDSGKKRVLRLDGGDTVGMNVSDIGYVSLVSDDGAGSVFAVAVEYAGEGTRVGSEAIYKMDRDGGNRETVYEITYGKDDRVMQYGSILSMTAKDGAVTFTVRDGGTLYVRTLSAAGEISETRCEIGTMIADAAVDPETGETYVSAMDGRVFRADADGAHEVPLMGARAWRVLPRGGDLYFTDLADRSVKVLSGGEISTVMTCDFSAYTVDARDGRVLTTDYSVVMFSDGGVITRAAIADSGLYAAAWIALFVLGLDALVMLLRAVARIMTNVRGEVLSRALIVISAAVLVGVLTTYLVLSETDRRNRETTADSLMLIGDVLVSQTDLDALYELRSAGDTGSEAYERLRAPLDAVIDSAYANNIFYYYALYVGDGETVYTLVDYEETVPVYYPAFVYPDSGYDSVLETGESLYVDSEVSAYGAWSYVIRAIPGPDGTPAAVMEIGVSVDQQMSVKRSLIWDVAFTVASAVLVIVMLVIEVLFFSAYLSRRRKSPDIVSRRFPLRAIMFMVFFADSVQDGFIAVLLTKLYVPLSFLPQSVGAALPMTAQLLFCALASLLAEPLCGRGGVRRGFSLGFFLQTAGLAICAFRMDFWGLLVGKSLAGFGLGLVNVTANTVAAMADGDHSAEAFTDINSGLLSGCTAGAGIGSILLMITDYRAAFIVAAVCALAAFFQTVTGANTNYARGERVRGGAAAFFRDRRAMSFLLLVLFPFLVTLAYRDYFFPVFAEARGLNEVWLSRVYMLSGLAIIYLGPVLTNAIIGKLGSRRAAIAASLMLCASLAGFALLPSVYTSLITMVVMSLAISFGYNAQSSHYASLPAVSGFGEARAMGVYTLFDSAGQTVGPLVYGAAMALPGLGGVLGIGVFVAVLLAAYIIITGKKAGKC